MKIDSIEDLSALADRLTSAAGEQNEAIQIQNRAIEGLGAMVEALEKTTRAFATLLDAHRRHVMLPSADE